jgi:hypothetical protein
MNTLLMATLLAASSAALADDVAVCAAVPNPTYADDVVAKLTADGRFDSVTHIDCGSTTPTADALGAYDAVLFFNDSGFADRVGLGNALADYVDGGGGAVEAVFSVADNLKIEGRFLDDGYRAMSTASQSSGPSMTLVAVDAGHDLLAGVESFDGGTSSFHGDAATEVEGATLVANWSDGDALIAEHRPSGEGTVVALNFYPPSSDVDGRFWNAATDGAMLMANALEFAAGGGPTLVVEGSCPGAMRFTFSGLTAGAPYALLSAATTGSFPLPAGPCAGESSGLSASGIRLRGMFTADAVGGGSVAPASIPVGACGATIQVVDLATCSFSNTGAL